MYVCVCVSHDHCTSCSRQGCFSCPVIGKKRRRGQESDDDEMQFKSTKHVEEKRRKEIDV